MRQSSWALRSAQQLELMEKGKEINARGGEGGVGWSAQASKGNVKKQEGRADPGDRDPSRFPQREGQLGKSYWLGLGLGNRSHRMPVN